jgi:hypothetical protein
MVPMGGTISTKCKFFMTKSKISIFYGQGAYMLFSFNSHFLTRWKTTSIQFISKFFDLDGGELEPLVNINELRFTTPKRQLWNLKKYSVAKQGIIGHNETSLRRNQRSTISSN